jgi:hypothetical protein
MAKKLSEKILSEGGASGGEESTLSVEEVGADIEDSIRYVLQLLQVRSVVCECQSTGRSIYSTVIRITIFYRRIITRCPLFGHIGATTSMTN